MKRIIPEIRCKIEALAVGELLTLITWLSGRLIGRLLFTAGVLLRLTLVVTLLRLSDLLGNEIKSHTYFISSYWLKSFITTA